MVFQGFQDSERKGLGPSKVRSLRDWSENQGNALRQDLAFFIECKNRVLIKHKHNLFGLDFPDFLRAFLTLTPGCLGIKKFLPITGAAVKHSSWCGGPRFSAKTSMTRRVLWVVSVRISSGGVGFFHVKRWGPKSSVCPSKPRESKVFSGISWDFAGISRGAQKV